jgi:sialate O-acetylesterase
LPAGAFYESLPFQIRKNLDEFIPEAKNMQVLYSVPIANIKDGNNVMYWADNSNKLNGKKIKKIGYFMCLENAKGKKFVYATVDPFTQDVTKLGLPTAEQQVFFQQIVKNLTVKSNVPGVTNGSFTDGNVEIWPSDYGMINNAKIENASDKVYDFGDGSATANRNGYGSLQLHNFRNKEVVFALNHFVGPNTDVGIGNNPNGHLDYTFANSSAQYSYGELLVLVEIE